MEKVWAERAGLGWIGKNGLLINRELGSWLTLSVMFLDRAVDVYDQPHEPLCGSCERCLEGCPTGAFPSPGVVDARLCLSYQSIENKGSVPERLRRGFAGRVFGCDICQDVCPWNSPEIPVGDRRFEPRALSALSPVEMAALTEPEFKAAVGGNGRGPRPVRRLSSQRASRHRRPARPLRRRGDATIVRRPEPGGRRRRPLGAGASGGAPDIDRIADALNETFGSTRAFAGMVPTYK